MKHTHDQYIGCCVSLDANDLNPMIDNAIDITAKTFFKHVPRALVDEMFTDYKHLPFRIDDDWAVSFHRSKYQGQTCYYLRHSAIEYVFCMN